MLQDCYYGDKVNVGINLCVIDLNPKCVPLECALSLA